MTSAALALALALVVAPRPSRHRLGAASWRTRRRRTPMVACRGGCVTARTGRCAAARRGQRWPPAWSSATLVLRRRRRRVARRARAAEGVRAAERAWTFWSVNCASAHIRSPRSRSRPRDRRAVRRACAAVAARARLGADVAAGLRSFAAASRLPGALGAAGAVLAAGADARPGDRDADARGASRHR